MSAKKLKHSERKWKGMAVRPDQHRRIRELIAQSGLRSDVVIDRMIDLATRALLPQSPEAGILAAAG